MVCFHMQRRFVVRNLAIGLLVALLVQLGVGASWAKEVAITILHTNDIHQELERLPYIAAYAAEYRRQHPGTVFVDAGDFFDRGSSLATLTRGEVICGAMSRMGYDLRIVGNHDWAYGAARLRELIAGCPGTVLGTNLAAVEPPLPGNIVRTAIKQFQGIRVGFFGITLDTYGKNPKRLPELYVLDAEAETARAVAELRPKVDLIVAVTHLGFSRMTHEKERECPTDVDLVRGNPGIQVVVGGHSHTQISEKDTRRVYDQTGAIIVQAGAAGKWVGRLTLWVDPETRRIGRFEIEHIDTRQLERADPAIAHYIQEQYDRYLPNAKVVLGKFAERMEFYNLAFWWADFLRQQAGADIALVPRKSLYDESASFEPGPVTVERLYGLVNQRRLIRAQVQGRDLLAFCRAEAVRDRFNPFHHQGRPFSGDAIYSSGMLVRYRSEDRGVDFSIDPERTYTLVAPWPFDDATARKYRSQLPDCDAAQAGPLLPGLTIKNPVVLPLSSRELLASVGEKEGLKFRRRYPQLDPQWKLWTAHFEEKLAPPKP